MSKQDVLKETHNQGGTQRAERKIVGETMRSELAKPPFCHKTKTNGSIGRREPCHTILVEREANKYMECHHERQMK